MPDGVKLNKNPDAMIGGRIFEFKNIERNTYEAISRELRKAGNQADYILLNISGYMDNHLMKRAIKGRILNRNNIKEVWLIKDGQLMKHVREYILGKDYL